jgi:hypothetical protein
MIRLKAKQEEKKNEAAKADTEMISAEVEEKPKSVKILGVGRGKRAGKSKEKKRTPGEIRIQKGTFILLPMLNEINKEDIRHCGTGWRTGCHGIFS